MANDVVATEARTIGGIDGQISRVWQAGPRHDHLIVPGPTRHERHAVLRS
jgi:hypothetical protein